MATFLVNSEPLVNVDILKKQHVCLVQNVDVDSVLPVLYPWLLYTEIETVKSKADRCSKTRELIDCLKRRTAAKSYEAFNAFMKILGGTQPELFTDLVGRCPTQTEADFCVKGLTSELKEVIKAKGHSTDSPLDEQIDLDREHIQLQIIKMQNDTKRFERTNTEGLYPSVCTESLPHQYQQRLSAIEKAGGNISACNILNAGGKSSKSVLLSGRAGVGKSTTLQWLARQWSLNVWAADFTILFLMPLRMLSSSDSHITVIELLTLYGLFQLTAVSSQNLLCKWIKNSKCRVLFLIDGLDEILGFSNKVKHAPKITTLDHKAHPIDLCINILRGDLLPGCTVVCTSRPFAGLSNLNTETALEMLGLTQKQVKRFVEVKHTEKAGQIMSVLQRNPILLSVCGITFYCMAVSTLLSEGVQMVDVDIQTYTRLTAFILVKYVSRTLNNYPFVIEVNSYFHKLAFLAYKGIFLPTDNAITKINFNEFDLARVGLSPLELDLIRKTGLLQIKDFTIGQRNSISTEFMHLTTQELLAVAYLLSRTVASKAILENIFSEGQFNMALLYLFGIQFDKKCMWIKDVCEAVSLPDNCPENDYHLQLSELLKRLCTTSRIPSTGKLKICQLVHESQLEDQAKAVVEYVAPGGVLDILLIPMTAIDMLAIAFVCRHSSALRKIALMSVNADDTCMDILSSSLIKPHVSSLEYLNVRNNNISAKGVEALVNTLQHSQHLVTLNVGRNPIGAGGVKALADAVRSMKILQELDVSFNHIGDEGANALAAALSTNESLTTLTLSHNDIGPDGAAALAEALHKNMCLQGLDVSGNHIGDDGAKTLAAALSTNESLTTLTLSDNDIGPDGAAALAEAMHKNMCLQELSVSGNHIGNEGAKGLARALCSNESLKTLKICNTGISIVGASALAEALRGNKGLNMLSVLTQEVGDEGVKVLQEVCNHTGKMLIAW